MPRLLLRFPIRKPRPAKADLRLTVHDKVQRGIARLPVLEMTNPDAAELACDLIDGWIGDDGPEDDRTHPPPPAAIKVDVRGRQTLKRIDPTALAQYAALALALGEDPAGWLARDHPDAIRKVS